MFTSDFERWTGKEVVILEESTVLVIFQGRLSVHRQMEAFGQKWSFEVRGTFLLLTPGTYVVEGEALIYFAANEPARSPPPRAQARQALNR